MNNEEDIFSELEEAAAKISEILRPFEGYGEIQLESYHQEIYDISAPVKQFQLMTRIYINKRPIVAAG